MKGLILTILIIPIICRAANGSIVFSTNSIENTSYQFMNSSDADLKVNMTPAEVERLEQIKNGVRGYQSPNLDPTALLGIESRNDAERRHYAELCVKQNTGALKRS